MATAPKNCLFESDGGNEVNYQYQACVISYRHLVNISAYVLCIEHLWSRLQTWQLCETEIISGKLGGKCTCMYVTVLHNNNNKINIYPICMKDCGRLRLKYDGTRAETRFRLSAKRTSPFNP